MTVEVTKVISFFISLSSCSVKPNLSLVVSVADAGRGNDDALGRALKCRVTSRKISAAGAAKLLSEVVLRHV